MKVVIVGGVAGGASTATRLRRLKEDAEILLIEKGEFISFANCGLPYFIGDVIKNKEDLLLQTPENFANVFNVDVRIKNEVIDVDNENKIIKILDIEKNIVYEEKYDKLVLSPGAEPINPFASLEGVKIRTLRTINDSIKIKEEISLLDLKHVTIIGGGFIGIEMAENIKEYTNAKVSIIEKAKHLIAPIDQDMASFVHNTLAEENIDLYLANGVKNIEAQGEKIKIELDEGELLTDYIILSIGVRPETNFIKTSSIKLDEKGAIIVNKCMQTSDENVYALGDAIKTENFVTGELSYITLAGPAVKQSRVVVNNILGKYTEYNKTLGSSILKIFGYSLAVVGISEETCIRENIDYKKTIISPHSHATYYPNSNVLTIKAIYSPETKQILGVQIWGKDKTDKIADIIATAIRSKMSMSEIEELELCYAPPFSSTKNPVNILANVIQNEIEGLVENISWDEIDEKALENIIILDVRGKVDFRLSHYSNAINIPLAELRKNLDKIDKKKSVYIYCYSGLNSYIGYRVLKQNGYNVRNIIGGYNLYKALNMKKN